MSVNMSPDMAQALADIASLTAALEALEEEIVGERVKALIAEATAGTLAEEVDDLRDRVRGLVGDRNELAGELREAENEINRLKAGAEEREAKIEREAGEGQDALSEWLVANGYPARPLRVADRYVQRLIDAIGV
jgi:chromosome segregation ATPase